MRQQVFSEVTSRVLKRETVLQEKARLNKLQATLAVVKALQGNRDDRLNQLQTRLQAREAGLDDREVEFGHRETWLN